MDTSYVTDTFEDSVNDTINEIINESANYETKEADENEVIDFSKQSIITKTSSFSQQKQPDQPCKSFKMDTTNGTNTCENLVNDSINHTINEIINESVNESREIECAEGIDVKPSITTKNSSISQKKQPDQLCNCPLHCDTKISKEWREKIYKQFGELGDHSLQNQYIQRHIKIKSIAKRLWEDEIIDKKIQRRVTCKYLIPLTGSVKESYSYAKTLNYESAKFALDTNIQESSKKVNSATNTPTVNGGNVTDEDKQPQTSDIEMKEIPQCNGTVNGMELDSHMEDKSSDNASSTKENGSVSSMELDPTTENNSAENSSMAKENSPINGMELDTSTDIKVPDNTNAIKENGTVSSVKQDTIPESKTSENGSSTKENISDVNSPSSFNDNESVNTADESNVSELDGTPCSGVKYVDVCQKAFMNMYGITEKRIRWQREKLILRSRYLAEKQKKELEEMDRTLSLARSLGAGCQPLFAFLEKSEYKQLSEQLLIAIEDDVMLVNNFFHNQLWKPEDIMNKSMHLSTSLDSCETDCDLTLN